jgi:hypothetical protein
MVRTNVQRGREEGREGEGEGGRESERESEKEREMMHLKINRCIVRAKVQRTAEMSHKH